MKTMCLLFGVTIALGAVAACDEPDGDAADAGADDGSTAGDSDAESDGSEGDADDEPDHFLPIPCGAESVSQVCEQIVEGSRWAFEPGDGSWPRAGSLIDLTYLNEDAAGATGFVSLSADGRGFVKGDGSPIRFWAVNSSVWENDVDALEEHARFLASFGVNLARWHGHVPRDDASSAVPAIDEDARDRLWRFVAAMRGEGIYSTVSPYYALRGVPGFNDDMHALLFVDAELQAAYREWLREIFVPENPYTGIALKDDPSVAIIQIQNEDSLLFWTINNLSGPFLEDFRGQLGDWLVAEHGSLDAATGRWDGVTAEGDAFAEGRVGFLNIWEMTQEQEPGSGRAARLADQARFWTETMRSFFAETSRFLREEIGAQQLVNAGNWKTADPVRLNDLERYACTATEVMAVNHYYNGGQHLGEHNGWAIVAGDRFEGRSVLRSPRELPISLKQVEGAPMLVTESLWVPPLGYQSEGPFLVAAYSSLTGVDSYFWFNFGQPGYREPSSANGYLPSLGKWVGNTPEIVGNFPAAALMFRRGYVHPGQTAVHERRELDEMWSLRSPIIAESPSYDPNRDSEHISEGSNIPGGVDPLAFLVGPVEVTYDADSSTSEVVDLESYVFEEEGVVCSQTGELRWDHDSGVVEVNAAMAQGVSGFLHSRGRFELRDVTIDSCNRYATVLVVSMDGEPLATSGSVLVQTGTVARPTGWEVQDAAWSDDNGSYGGFEIVSFGEPPWQIERNDVTITLGNESLSEAVVLAADGTPRETLPLDRDGGTVVLTLPEDTKYVVLR